jgi:uncharacterized OB-fold protein
MAAEISLPESLRDVELVRSVRTPARLEFIYTPGEAATKFLRAVGQKRLIGARAPGGKVYVPPRGADPQLGKPTTEEVELAHVGTVTSFCVVNVAFYGSQMELPYTSALIKLDGADQPIMHLLQEVATDDVRIGMRVEAVWVPDDEIGETLESIKHFRPTGEPDVEVIQPQEGVTW